MLFLFSEKKFQCMTTRGMHHSNEFPFFRIARTSRILKRKNKKIFYFSLKITRYSHVYKIISFFSFLNTTIFHKTRALVVQTWLYKRHVQQLTLSRKYSIHFLLVSLQDFFLPARTLAEIITSHVRARVHGKMLNLTGNVAVFSVITYVNFSPSRVVGGRRGVLLVLRRYLQVLKSPVVIPCTVCCFE